MTIDPYDVMEYLSPHHFTFISEVALELYDLDDVPTCDAIEMIYMVWAKKHRVVVCKVHKPRFLQSRRHGYILDPRSYKRYVKLLAKHDAKLASNVNS